VVAVAAPVPRRTKGEGLDEVAHRALLALVSAPQILLDSGVGGGAGVEGAKGAGLLALRAPLDGYPGRCNLQLHHIPT
jgi:hypothetical protein